MNYTPNVRKSAQTFVNVLKKAKEWFASLIGIGLIVARYTSSPALIADN